MSLVPLHGESYAYRRAVYSTPVRARSPKAAAPVTVVDRHVKFTTKAQMDDPVAVEAVPKHVSPVVSKADAQVAALVHQIRASKASGAEFSHITVPCEIWPLLHENVSEERARFEYCSHTELLIVTWPTDVHEAFKWTIAPFVNIAQSDNAFVWETNTEIQLTRGPHDGDRLTPDFAFGKLLENGSTQFSIVVESAFSQSANSLDEKAQKYLTCPDIECVIGLNFVGPSFNNPTLPCTTGGHPLQYDAFVEAAQISDEGPVEYNGHTWAPVIKQIILILWVKGRGSNLATREEWDISPRTNNVDLATKQTEVVKILRKVTRGVVGKDEFKIIYRDTSEFKIDWQGFYPDLRRRLISDAFKRCYEWTKAGSSSSDGTVIEISRSSAKKRALEVYGVDSDDSEEEVKEPPEKAARRS
ncbi:hypothetical protein DFH07DRAFT_297055 [Mycena maculata]|uniref:Uncharacterized protein n=1 Tax=Mycena maculata TaxID=230809 RepID=A0AAD7HJW9_9AGAR|nr:hypothetical protein DFH07DRAFT_297055 [Mycena maculata]